MMVTSAASSHQKSSSNQPREVAIDATKATVMAMAISSIIPGWRARSSWAPPARNGQPPQKKMTEPRTGPTSSTPGKDRW
jgi:hypothetical protein